MTSVLAVGVATLCFLAYATVRASLTAEVDRTLLHEADEYSVAMRSSARHDLARGGISRATSQDHTGASAGPDPILLVLADGRIISNSELKLEQAAGNAAAKEPTSAPAGFVDATLGGRRLPRALGARSPTPTAAASGSSRPRCPPSPPAAVAASVAGALGAAGLIVDSRRRLRLGLGGSAEPAAAAADGRPTLPASRTPPRAGASPTTARADELGSLASSLNAMLARLERSYQDQRRFVADASHELRTPVAIVRGNVELLRPQRRCAKRTPPSRCA